MNLLDVIIIVFLLIGVVRGFFNGLISELASLIALVLGIWIAYHFSDRVFMLLSNFIDEPGSGTLLLSYLIVFILVVMVVNLAARIITKMIGFLALGLVNKLLGSVFGFLKTLLLLLILTFLLKPIFDSELIEENDFFTNSQLLPVLLSYSDLVGTYLNVIISSDAAQYRSA